MVLTADFAAETDAVRALNRERQRQQLLLERATASTAHPVVQQLVLAADQFIVQRGTGKTIIAGYPWFNDWGRDTMISLPGLALTTGRGEDAADILCTFARYVDAGMLPNNFPDSAGDVPGYNTVDATLWYLVAVAAYERFTHDTTLVDELLPVLRSIVDWHRRGTRDGIEMDPRDGLLRAGEPGVQLTWMDARLGDWVVTPRIGKPVEINALWYNALHILVALVAERSDHQTQAELEALAQRVQTSFVQRFWRPNIGYLADVVDGPEGDDLTLRPNQIFALSLPYPLIGDHMATTVVDAVGRALLTGSGLRSLSPADPAYHGQMWVIRLNAMALTIRGQFGPGSSEHSPRCCARGGCFRESTDEPSRL